MTDDAACTGDVANASPHAKRENATTEDISTRKDSIRRTSAAHSTKKEPPQGNHNANGDDDLSSLGDASPMREAERRQKERVQKAHARLRKVICFVVVLALTTMQLSSMNSQSYFQAALQKQESLEQVHNNITRLQQLRQDHLSKVSMGLSKLYKPMSANIWCIDSRLKFEQGKRRPMGLCYVKIPRAASSYLAGVNQRIALNFAKRFGLSKSCIRHDGHVPGMYYAKRDPLSFLWTFLRNPTDRALSRVAHALSKVRGGAHGAALMTGAAANDTGTPTTSADLNLLANYTIQALRANKDLQYGAVSSGRGGFQLQYSMLQMIPEGSAWNATDPTTVQDPKAIHQHVFDVMARYDFIGVVERMDESLVALQLLLGLKAEDILQLKTMTHDQYERRNIKGNFRCIKGMDPASLKDLPSVQQYLDSAEWFAQNYGDYLYHATASLSLDRTILKIGLPIFAKALKEYRQLKQHAEEICTPKFACLQTNDDNIMDRDQSEEAEEDCYDGDHIGCGYRCLDSIATVLPKE